LETAEVPEKVTFRATIWTHAVDIPLVPVKINSWLGK
jgi:hypothetical protein